MNGITPSYPPILEQAGNAIKAAAGFIASGFTTANEEEQERRLEICHSCPEFDGTQGRCRKCGCLGTWKVRIASQQCPLGKW